MRLTNDSYLVTLHAGNGAEHYFRRGSTWVKESTQGRKFPATAEQVLNHILPALAGIKPNVSVSVEHRDLSESAARSLRSLRETRPTHELTPHRMEGVAADRPTPVTSTVMGAFARDR